MYGQERVDQASSHRRRHWYLRKDLHLSYITIFVEHDTVEWHPETEINIKSVTQGCSQYVLTAQRE